MIANQDTSVPTSAIAVPPTFNLKLSALQFRIGTFGLLVRSIGRKTNLLEEIGRVVGEAEANRDLAKEYHASNLSAAELKSGEAVYVRRSSGELLLEIVCVDDSGESLFWIDRRRLSLQTSQ